MSQETARGALTIPGGGDTIKVLKALRKAEADEEFRFGFETTGGGASGNLIALGFQGRPEELPGFASLTDRK